MYVLISSLNSMRSQFPISNHPFIIFIKARQHGSRTPLTFLQKAHKDSLIYASWVAKNLTDMEAAELDVLDPFLAYLVGIAASIHIEHSLSSVVSTATAAEQKLATCMAYLNRVSRIWPRTQKRIVVLEDLRARVGNRSALHCVDDEYDGAVPIHSARHVSMSEIDERLLWTLFDSSNDPVQNTLHPDTMTTGSGSRNTDLAGLSEHVGSNNTTNNAPLVGSTIQSRPDENVASHSAQGVSALDQFPSIDSQTADWSLLGMPWMAYFPSATEPLTYS